MRTQEVVIDGKTRFRIVMVEESIGIEEVVVTALGIERNKRSLSYATELVDVTSISDIRDPSLATRYRVKLQVFPSLTPLEHQGWR